jgi:hypothetical protein
MLMFLVGTIGTRSIGSCAAKYTVFLVIEMFVLLVRTP